MKRFLIFVALFYSLVYSIANQMTPTLAIELTALFLLVTMAWWSLTRPRRW